MFKNITNWARWSLTAYLITLVTVSVIPLGRVSKELTDITVVHLRGDYFLHLLVYIPLLTLMSQSFKRLNWKMVVISIGIAFGLEYIQKLLPYRCFNINDLIANVSGVLLGIIIALIIRKYFIKD